MKLFDFGIPTKNWVKNVSFWLSVAVLPGGGLLLVFVLLKNRKLYDKLAKHWRKKNELPTRQSESDVQT